jgi:hypothetical protein
MFTHTHPVLIDPASGAPLRAIGFRLDGRPIWPVLGAAEDGGDTGGTGDGANQGGGTGDGGAEKSFTQADVDKLIGQRLARETSKYADYDTYRQSHVELEQLKAANASELDKAKREAKAEGIAEVTTKVNGRLIASEARALASALDFHNPADVVGLVDLSTIRVNNDGEVDSEAIKALIAALAKERPYLIKGPKEDPKPGKPKPDHSQGPRGGGTGTTADQFAAALTPILSP